MGELVEFAEFLESKKRRGKSKNRDEILAAYGAFDLCRIIQLPPKCGYAMVLEISGSEEVSEEEYRRAIELAERVVEWAEAIIYSFVFDEPEPLSG